MGDSVEGLATGVDDDMSAVILCVPSPQLVEVAAIPNGEARERVRFQTPRGFVKIEVVARAPISQPSGFCVPPSRPKGFRYTHERREHESWTSRACVLPCDPDQ